MSKKLVLWLVAIIIVILGVIWLAKLPEKPGKYDSFAACIKDSGTLFYGTFWCLNCQNQKAKFGSSAKILPYIECSTVDGKNQLPICAEADITGYPTWIFSDGTREMGDTSLERLSEITSCLLPTQTDSPTEE